MAPIEPRAREARAAGFGMFLKKPIDPTDIVHTVATLVNRRRVS